MSRIRKNEPTPSNLRDLFAEQNFCETAPLYQCVDGGETTDISKALTNSEGIPLFVGYSNVTVPATFLDDPDPLTLNPAFPEKRLQAIANRECLGKMFSQGNIYGDPLYNLQRVNSAAQSVADQLDELTNNNNN